MNDVSVVALFCDDIRQEASGTVTIVGVYPDNVNVPKIPGGLLKLGIYVRIHLDPSFAPVPISTWLELPDGKELNRDEVDPKLVRDALSKASTSEAPYAGLIASFVIANFGITEPGRVKAMVQLGDQKIVAGALNVRVPRPDAPAI
jgi:hypothetical protein